MWGGNTDSRGQFDIRIALRTAEATQTNLILGQGAHGQGWRASDLFGEGEFLIQSSRHTVPEPDRAYWLDDDVLAAHIQQFADDGRMWEPAEEPDPFAASSATSAEGKLRDKIRAYVRAFGPAVPATIAEGVGAKGNVVRSQLSKMARVGLVERDEKTGMYSAPGAAPPAAPDAPRLHVVRGGRAGQR